MHYYRLHFNIEKPINIWFPDADSLTFDVKYVENLKNYQCAKCKRILVAQAAKNCVKQNEHFWQLIKFGWGSFRTGDGMPILSHPHYAFLIDMAGSALDFYYESPYTKHGIVLPKRMIYPPSNLKRAHPSPLVESESFNGWRNHGGVCKKCGQYREVTIDFEELVVDATEPVVGLVVHHSLHAQSSLNLLLRDDLVEESKKWFGSEVQYDPLAVRGN